MTTQYRIRQLGHQLKTGTARIAGLSCSGARWPEGAHRYIVEDLERQETVLVDVTDRPGWKRYLPAESR